MHTDIIPSGISSLPWRNDGQTIRTARAVAHNVTGYDDRQRSIALFVDCEDDGLPHNAPEAVDNAPESSEAAANANFVVRAVNAFEPLVSFANLVTDFFASDEAGHAVYLREQAMNALRAAQHPPGLSPAVAPLDLNEAAPALLAACLAVWELAASTGWGEIAAGPGGIDALHKLRVALHASGYQTTAGGVAPLQFAPQPPKRRRISEEEEERRDLRERCDEGDAYSISAAENR